MPKFTSPTDDEAAAASYSLSLPVKKGGHRARPEVQQLDPSKFVCHTISCVGLFNKELPTTIGP